MNPKTLKLIYVIYFLLLNCSCQAKEEVGVLSELCVSIEVNQESTKALLEEFDSFAKINSLPIDNSHPLAREYGNAEIGEIIRVSAGMGPFGTIVSYFNLSKKSSSDLKASLSKLVFNNIGGRFSVKNCHNIEDFKPPKLYK